jgi:hypothetical protein
MKLNEQGIAHLLILAATSGLFVTGAGVTVASNSSKPGDALYSIDRGAEKLQLALALTGGLKQQAHKSIAEERLTEIQALLQDKDVDAAGIANALANFEDHKSKAGDSKDDDALDEKEKSIKHDIEDKKSQIDKQFESQQKKLESQREQLKKQYEQALKDGNTTLAASLKVQIDGIEGQLKADEQSRESQKQETEEQSESEKKQAEAEKKEAEQKSEDEKKAEEAKEEAEKQAQEQH